jgi:hypothetical protein
VGKYIDADAGRTPIPSVPTIGTATDGGTGTTASITFTPGYYAGDYYTALSSPGSITATSNISPITVSGLTSGTAYTFTVTATNGTGTSAASAASNSVTPAVPSSFESIATATGTGSSGTITFSSIPSTYKHLQIRFRAFANSENPAMYIRLNSDSATNYSWHYLYGTGSAAGAAGAATQAQMNIADYGVMSNATYPTVAIIDLVDYASTSKYKTVRTFLGTDKNNAFAQGIELVSGLWRSTSAVSSISLTVSGANFTSASTFALYGIKGS